MATRKSRQNTESPTPSGTESVPSTPTTPATRNTRSIRNKQLQLGKTEETTSSSSSSSSTASSIQIKAEKIDDEEEAVKDTTNDEEVSKTTVSTPVAAVSATSETETPPPAAINATEKSETKSEVIEQNDAEKEKEKDSSPPAASTRRPLRRTAAAKEETTAVDKPTESVKTESPNTPTDGKTSPTKTKRSRRSAFELLTDDHPDLTPSILSSRRNSTGKIDKPTQRKLSSRIRKLKQLRKTPLRAMLRKPPEKLVTVVNKPIKQLIEKQAAKGTKVEKSDSASDSELVKVSRRRSDSVSKCSDMTDASSFQETKDSNEDLPTQSTEGINSKAVVIKEETSEKDETVEDKQSAESVPADGSRNANDSSIVGDSDSSQTVKPDSETSSNDGSKRASRFSRRKRPLNPPNPTRVMSTRSRSETPSKPASEPQDDDEDGATPKDVKKEKTETPLQIDTMASETTADEKLLPELQQTNDNKAKTGDGNEKAKSLSPVLVSEGVSEISVKQFYGRADFLENNLGIEKDPKLGEIVQIQEKIKAVSDTSEEPSKLSKQSQEDCTMKPDEEMKKPVETMDATDDVNELDTSTESMEVDENTDAKIDGADCDERNAKDAADCFIKPTEIVRRDSATILNENVLVLNGEIELTSKKEKKEVTRTVEEDVGEVVLYKISNGVRLNPEKLESVLESQKLKEKERSSSIESGGGSGDGQSSSEDNGNKDKKDKNAKMNSFVEQFLNHLKACDAKHEEPIQSNKESESKAVIDVDANLENPIKPAAVRSNLSSKDSRSSSLDDESPEEKIQKESHLKTLGLLTHQAAEEATIEKQKQREKIKANKGKKNSEYTGTLKTVIKLHRGNDKKKGNQPLKMTLHKGRVKNGSDKSDSHSTANSEEDTYYTIQQQDMDSFDHEADEAAAKEHEKLLVIPEKASSFRYHPEKICEDQCFYCGGKFGLFDTPCHIAQIKSAERQKKILEYEEKLTVDSCLCDACFRHVDRRANCPSYKKRLSEPSKTQNDSNTAADDSEDKETETYLFQHNREVTFCQVHECKEQASHSMCRKWALKVRKTLNKHIQLNLDNTTSMAFLPICDKHYEDINHMLICMLCNRRLKRNHCYFLSQDAQRVESLIANEGIHVNVGTTYVACKLCRYYVNMLLRPQESKKMEFIREYRKRILEYHGKVDLVEDDSEDSTTNHDSSTKRSKRSRKTLNDQHSDDVATKVFKSSRSSDVSMEMVQDLAGTSTRTRQKNKQMNQQQLLEEQKRVEKRVQQEQLKLKQQEFMQQQQQKLHDELRQQQIRSSNEDISNLRTNPNISMRELFPGEEEMGINMNIPFGNSWRTPDGWQKVTSTIQYDEPTRKLWEDLQKPYGNQSSFIRHLLLLEKYFRNGDLLLVQNANHNAITYCESVQHRLQAFDNISPRPVSISQILPQNSTTQTTAMDLATNSKSITTANKAVTISKVSAQPTPSQSQLPPPLKQTSALSITPNPKPNTNTNDGSSTSLLKPGVAQIPRSTKSYTVTTEPINNIDLTKATNSITNSIGASTSANMNTNIPAATPKNKNPGLPPELICIATPSNDASSKHTAAAASTVPPPSYQLQMQLTLQQQIQQQHQNSLRLPKQMLQNMVPTAMVPTTTTSSSTNQITSPKKQQTTVAPSTSTNKSPTNSQSSTTANVIRLPDALTDAERRDSKNWRPILMPISAEKNNTDGKLYQTADGRRLPYLVQVLSGGKPYMISIHDYNRMCILRRERLLKDQTELMKNKSNQNSNNLPVIPTTAAQKQPPTVPPLTTSTSIVNNANAAKTTAAPDVDKVTKQHGNTSTSSNNGQMASKVQVPNKILEQNSLIPINSHSSSSSSSSSSSKPNENSSDSLLRFRFSKSKSSLLKSNASHHAKPSMPPQLIPTNTNVTTSIAAPNPLAKLPIPLSNVLSQSNVVSITSTPSISAMLGMTQASTPPPIQLIPNPAPPITITNVTSGSGNNVVNQSTVSSLEALFRTTNQVTTTPTTMWQWAEQLNKSSSITPIDNSATSILSKIPKSLTVIPQQKNKGIDE